MEILESIQFGQQGSEASSEYSERLAQAAQHEAEKPIEEFQDNGAVSALNWRDSKNQQLNQFIHQLEKDGIQRNKFGQYNNQAEIK